MTSIPSVSSLRSDEVRSDISSILGPDKEHVLSERMHHIVTNFRNRAFTVRQRLEEAPSPEDESVFSEEEDVFASELVVPAKSAAPDTSQPPLENAKGLIEKLIE